MNRPINSDSRAGPAMPGILLLLLIFWLPARWGGGAPVPGQQEDPIKIGFLVAADTSADRSAKQAADAVQLVADRVNASGGIGGRPVKMVLKSTEGHWGAGSKRSVDLIYEDGVHAILGFLDGRSAHLVEQVCTKAEVPFLSVYSPDPTLSGANIPWFFSIMPHAGQQAELLVAEIHEQQPGIPITIVASDTYDQEYLVRSLIRVVKRIGYPAPSVLRYPAGAADLEGIAAQVSKTDMGAILFLGSAEEWKSWGGLLADFGVLRPHFLPVMEFDSLFTSRLRFPVWGIRSEGFDRSGADSFGNLFRNRYGYRPGRYAYYLHDGMLALLQSIRSHGATAEGIQQGLSELNVSGITGPVFFDASGRIMGRYGVVRFH